MLASRLGRPNSNIFGFNSHNSLGRTQSYNDVGQTVVSVINLKLCLISLSKILRARPKQDFIAYLEFFVNYIY